jgi:UDP-N-acetylglucosamine 4,6-dehydratase
MTYFITGGTGSFGTAFVKRHSDKPLVVYSRDEQKQYEMAKWAKNVTFVIGDVRDAERIRWAMQTHRPTLVIHAAALKHVATGETHPYESVRTNIAGTQNVVNAALATDSVFGATFLSSDKACSPVNLYGATKMVAEHLWRAGNAQRGIFTAVRYGNVIGSRGSVLHEFNQYQDDGTFKIHDKRMTRFAVTLDYAVRLVEKALGAPAGITLVSKVPSMRIVDLARAFNRNAMFKETGVAVGEKLAESLLTEYERARAVDQGDYWELPPGETGPLPQLLRAYSSNGDEHLSIEAIEGMVNEALRDC